MENKINNDNNNINQNNITQENEVKNEIIDTNIPDQKPINEIKNEIIDINIPDQKPINEIKNEIININSKEQKTTNEFKKDPNKKYKIKFSQLIEEQRQNSDMEEKMSIIEYNTNLLLMSSQINQTNKISCLTLLSYINYIRENALYTYYLNKKIFKYLQIQKSIESFIYIRTLYRAAVFLVKEKNFFYAKKYTTQAENLSNNSKIDLESKKMLKDINNIIDKGIDDYLELYLKKFRDVENPENLTDNNYLKMKKLFKDLNESNYQVYPDVICDENSILYIVSKNWFIKAYQFFMDYSKIRDNWIKGNYFREVFDANYCYQSYFDIYEELQKNSYKNSPFPCLIDNYSIINWTDNLLDPLNEDENIILKKNLKEGKDYLLLEKKDFELLENFFGVTNIIKRKKTDLIEFKAIILDKNLYNEDNFYILRKRHLQISKSYNILDLKEKIIRCINNNLETVQKEKELLEKLAKKRKEKEKEKLKEIEKTYGLKTQNKKEDKENEENIKKEEIIQEAENKKNNNIKLNNNDYSIHFYLLEKLKKDILMEICVSLVNDLTKYESIFLQKISISEKDSISNLISLYDKKKHILIIELQNNNSPLFINPLIQINNKYLCSSCNKEIDQLSKSYKCNICNYSLYCSEECSNKDQTHEKLDEIYLKNYLYEEFDLNSFLKKDISSLTMLTPQSPKGMVGLMNLGNTCYINSTLQCLSNTFDLTKYFLLQYFRNDINTGNKLGSNGSVALKYYGLLTQMWLGTGNKINPSEFINNFKKYKKQFEGNRQQDAQEFLSVLLDQLHEDLNRITEKPYIELLEKQTGEDDLVASKRWWDLHKKREDSIIIDLFNGQFKSETICQECHKSSITYDPFMSLCVPLPKTKILLIFKIFIDVECKYFEFKYESNNTILDLYKKAKEFVSAQKQKSEIFDLEMVLLDENKTVDKIISTDIKNKKNYMGGVELGKILTTKNEIIFFEKKIISDEKDYISFFIYPIEHQKPIREYVYHNHGKPLKYLSYPLFFQIKQDTTVNELINKVLNRIRSLNFYVENNLELYHNRIEYSKIIQLNLIHSKDTKKDGFLSWFYIEDICKFCNESNETNYYCPISKLGTSDKKVKEAFQKVKKPVILAATSDCYNLNGGGRIYLESDLFTSNTNSDNYITSNYASCLLKDCLQLFVTNENFQDESWYCSNCKKLQKSKQKLEIYKPPNYLIILIKRYNFNKNLGTNIVGEKNNTFISYPTNNFDIREYIVGPEKDKAIYDLYGVIEHYGTLNQGHYTAICKNDGNWVSYNDSVIKIVDNPVTKNAYVLFYKMKNIGETNQIKEGK